MLVFIGTLTKDKRCVNGMCTSVRFSKIKFLVGFPPKKKLPCAMLRTDAIANLECGAS